MTEINLHNEEKPLKAFFVPNESNLKSTLKITNNKARQYAEQAERYKNDAKIFRDEARYYSEQNSNVTKSYVDEIDARLTNAIYLKQDAGDYALRSELPSKVSELQNDSDYVTELQMQNAVDAVIPECNYDGKVLYSSQEGIYWDNLPSIANQSLSNLTTGGNSRFQYAPFSINNGTVTNGENATLHLPSGSQSDIEVEFIQPVLSANGTVGGDDFAVFASSENGVRAAYKAFDADTGYGFTDSWDPYPQAAPCYIGWYNPNPLKMESLTIRNSTTDSKYSYWVKSGELQYSSDGENWFTEQAFTNTVSGNGAYWTIDVDNPVLSKYKRLYITAAGNNNRPVIANIQFNNAVELATVEAGTTLVCDSCTITTADGRSKSFNGSSTIDITGVSDGKYKVFKDIIDGSLSLNELVISSKEPIASSGDLWLDTSEAPLSLKLYNGTLWTVSNDRVYLGDITIEQGVITEIENTEFNKNTNLVNSSTIANYAMPSNTYIDLTLGASGSTYTAPADGWFYVNKIAGADWHYVTITNTSKVNTGYSDWRADYRTSPLTPMLPVQKGDVVEIVYNATGATQAFKFIYAQGSEKEAN